MQGCTVEKNSVQRFHIHFFLIIIYYSFFLTFPFLLILPYFFFIFPFSSQFSLHFPYFFLILPIFFLFWYGSPEFTELQRIPINSRQQKIQRIKKDSKNFKEFKEFKRIIRISGILKDFINLKKIQIFPRDSKNY